VSVQSTGRFISKVPTLLGEVVAALGGAALLGALLLPWFNLEDKELAQGGLNVSNGGVTISETISGGPQPGLAYSTKALFDVGSVVPFAAALLALGVLALLLIIYNHTSSVRRAPTVVVAIGIASLAINLYLLVSPPSLEGLSGIDPLVVTPALGAWVGVVAALLIAAGGFLMLANRAAASAAPALGEPTVANSPS
jgi:hypothetical protein